MIDIDPSKFYRLFDSLPGLPGELEQLCLDQLHDDNLTRYLDPVTLFPLTMDTHYEQITDADGEPVPCADYRRFNAPRLVVDWVNKNIHPALGHDDFEIGIQVFRHCHPGQSAVYAPHVVGPRGAWAINYIFAAGGSDVNTCWYQQGRYPIIRYMAHHRGLNLKSFQGLNEIHRVRLAERRWHGLEVRALHTVVDLESDRISLSMGASLEVISDLLADRFQS